MLWLNLGRGLAIFTVSLGSKWMLGLPLWGCGQFTQICSISSVIPPFGADKPETIEWQINVECIDAEIFISACKTTFVISAAVSIHDIYIRSLLFDGQLYYLSYLLYSIQTDSGAHPAYPVGTRDNFPGRKAVKAWNRPPPSVSRLRWWSHISILLYVFMV
jgi:hypothetical protein